MTEKELIELKELLPAKWINILIERTGFSRSAIQKVLSGKQSNIEIIQAAMDLASEHQKKLSDIKKQFNSLKHG